MNVFGPIPSRRLGRSLGINNIPPKTCSYSCVYCQVGRTNKMHIERQKFYEPAEILYEAAEKVAQLKKLNKPIDYLTFVPDGEPTLDINLGYIIDLLKSLNIKIAVITNGSLLWKKDVREDLFKSDLVSIKIDSVIEKIWRKINRPHHKLALSKLIEGIDDFCRHFKGNLLTETMLVGGINDTEESLVGTAELINWIEPATAYLLIPTRPPAESWVIPPSNEVINKAFQIFNERINKVELISGYEGNDFTYTGDLEEELSSTLSVHPMREDAVETLIAEGMEDQSVLKKLLHEGKVVEVEYNGKKYLQRNFSKNST
ncbi:MAG: radical SAM protein [Ignavibacteria bacterium]|nr:radical SAM protein [Ignavibacteria bacterium]MBT8384029.1 radical SAM protein [Ignavibacteria bacterium]MBT8392262.1 radical SAM protein [Ignavibacteria bacterium]NNJ52505.1 radical SAM protein [Ignavibacteriaceae bacterium]NNL21787.1 radical SAM protein [Ignavibacteriaceae bacterium]